MCRFSAYFGEKQVLIKELLVKPENSLVNQSHKSKKGIHKINADGFGFAWYDFSIDKYPGVFKSIQPAWNDTNLMHLASKIKSSCFLAHIRASTVGDVTQNNCHPFDYNEYSLVHNGTIRNFDLYKKSLINIIDEDLFLNIKGNTDSEHLLHLIMHYLRREQSLIAAVKKSLMWVAEAQAQSSDFSRINIVITNGQELVATRYVSKSQKSLTLKYLNNKTLDDELTSIILSSEPLDEDSSDWNDLPENHYIYINKRDMQMHLGSLCKNK